MKTNNVVSENLNFGDVLTRPKFPFIHEGVYIGDGRVFHNIPVKGEHITDLSEFADKKKISVRSPKTRVPEEIRKRIEDALLNPKSYHPVISNCQNTTTRIVEGRSYSTQLYAAIGIALSAVTLIGTAAVALVRRRAK